MDGGRWVIGLSVALVLLLLTPGPAASLAPPATGPGARPPLPAGSTLVNYTSSVDGANLSYYEWLPASYQPSVRYPLAVFLHGLGYNGSEIFLLAGGLASIANASRFGFLLISINTRTPAGFYVNSPYTGPQEQDVLDAIAHEESLRLVNTSAVYLFGSSMGTMGSWSIAGHHPGLVRGIGAVAECPEAFMASYYHLLIGQGLSYFNTTGGFDPNQTAYALAQTYYLDSPRYYPQNYSNVLMYAVQGGADNRCPNNPNLFGYQQSNNTFLNATCLTLANWSQPPNCQTPFWNLSLANPGAYLWRFVYEPTGTHTLNDLDPEDMFAFWLGQEPVGLYCALMGDTPVVCPGAPSVPAPVAQPSALDANTSLALSVAPAGGTAPYTYLWHGLPPGCVSANASHLACSPSSPGTFGVWVGVTDANRSENLSPTVNVTVHPALSATAIPSSTRGPPPFTVTFDSRVTGGTLPLAVRWAFGDGTTANEANVSHVYLAEGTYVARLAVNDSAGATAYSNVTIVVAPTPFAVAGPTASSPSVDLGQSVTFAAGVVDPTSVYAYAWTGLPPGCLPANASAITCTPTQTGPTTISVTVRDLVGDEASGGPLAFTVFSDPTLSSFAVSRAVVDVGQPVMFTAAATGGLGPYSVEWTVTLPGCAAGTTLALTCAPVATGNWTAGVRVTDSNGLTASGGPLAVTVNPWPAIETLAGDRATVGVGSAWYLNATLSGGTPPFTWSYQGLPTGCSSVNDSRLRCVPDAAGNFTVRVTVADAVGAAASGVRTVSVTGSSPGPGSSLSGAGVPVIDWAVGAAVAAAAGSGLLVVRARRRRRSG